MLYIVVYCCIITAPPVVQDTERDLIVFLVANRDIRVRSAVFREIMTK